MLDKWLILCLCFILPRCSSGQRVNDVTDGVLDFGGGVGAYMTSFRDAGVTNFTVLEPHDLGGCLFKGLKQIKLDLVNRPLERISDRVYSLVITAEVYEHILVQYHRHVILALTKMSSAYLLFSTAHPRQT